MTRQIYLEDLPLDEAWDRFTARLEAAALWRPLAAETVPLAEALGRVTAAAVWARLSSPHYHACAMDGYAVRSGDTVGATETRPISLALVEDAAEAARVARPAQPVNTGQPLPGWADAVIMIEQVQSSTAGADQPAIEVRAAVPPWQHVRPMGEDMVATELVLPANHRLRPVDLGALAGSGHTSVAVYRRPRVAIIPTGSELITIERAAEEIAPGEIIEYNSLVLAAQVEQWGGIAARQAIVPDALAAVRAAVTGAAAAGHDLILVNAGSSAGSEDYTARAVQETGELLVHGVAVRPGHPVILGVANRPGAAGAVVPVIGVPGYPVSAALTGELFVEPLLARWQGQPAHRAATIQAQLARKIASPAGDDDFVRVVVGQVGDRVTATPIGRGAGVITSLVRADGLIRIPRFSEGLRAGEGVTVHLYRPAEDIARTIVAIGSHDLTLDLLAQYLAEQAGGRRLTSANVGSLGGLLALRRGEAHLAGAHLLDPETGEYNVNYVRRYLPNTEVVLVTLVGREQGWIVAPGNPKGVTGWEDAGRPGVRIVNRQRGAGTRVLLDYELAKRGVEPASVEGYGREEFTHLAVAAAIASGVADAGPGIRAAARALDLDFVPLARERYDLVIPRPHYESPLLRPLLDLLHDDAFRAEVAALPGYDVRPMGEIISL